MSLLGSSAVGSAAASAPPASSSPAPSRGILKTAASRAAAREDERMRGFHAARGELSLKVLFIGAAGSGKSSIVRAVAAAAAAPVEAITDEAGALETTRCSFGKIEGRRVSLHCWEVSYERFIAPSARPNPLHLGLIFSGVHAAVLVFDALAAGGTLPSTAPAHVFKEATLAAAVRPLEAVDDMVDAVHARLLAATGSAAVQPPVYMLAHKADTIASLAALRGAAAVGQSGDQSGSGDAGTEVESWITGAAAPSAQVRLASPLPRGALAAAYAAPTQMYACGLDADALSEFCAGAGIRRWFWTSTVEGPLTFGPGASASAAVLHSGSSAPVAGGTAAPAAATSGAATLGPGAATAASTARGASGAGASSRTDASRPDVAAAGAASALSSAAGPAAQASGSPGRCSSSLGHFLSGLLEDCLQVWGSERDAPEPLVQPTVNALHTAVAAPSSLLF